MSSVKVSVIIPVYNGSLLICRCLDSIFSQKSNYDLEVIVVDDGSNDNSSELVINYVHPVRIIKQDNLGPAAARNKGIDAASGKYIAFLDADDYWFPDFIKDTVGFMETSPEAIAVSVGQIHKIPGKPDLIAPEIIKSRAGRYFKPLIINDFYKFWAENNHVCTGSVLMRTDIARLSGGQREELLITEDLEFWAYLATYGKWGFIPNILFVSDGGSVTKQKGWLEKNTKRWESSQTVEVWEKRIIERLRQPLTEGYLMTQGRIAGNIAYSMILSFRDNLARQTIIKYRKYLQNNIIVSILKITAPFFPLWKVTCILFRFREYTRRF